MFKLNWHPARSNLFVLAAFLRRQVILLGCKMRAADWQSLGAESGQSTFGIIGLESRPWPSLVRTALRQLRSLIMSLTARSSPEGLGARRHLAAIVDRLPQLPSPLSVKRLQKKADSISVLVYADARCRSAGLLQLVHE